MIEFVMDDRKTNELSGFEFDGIKSNWQGEMHTRIINNADKPLEVWSFAQYKETMSNKELAKNIYIELFVDGKLKNGKDTFKVWKRLGIPFTIQPKQIVVVDMKFTTGEIEETIAGRTGIFDFEFGIQEN
jgi:hypothetical protein